MGRYDRPQDPVQSLRRTTPRTGPPVQNMGGFVRPMESRPRRRPPVGAVGNRPGPEPRPRTRPMERLGQTKPMERPSQVTRPLEREAPTKPLERIFPSPFTRPLERTTPAWTPPTAGPAAPVAPGSEYNVLGYGSLAAPGGPGVGVAADSEYNVLGQGSLAPGSWQPPTPPEQPGYATRPMEGSVRDEPTSGERGAPEGASRPMQGYAPPTDPAAVHQRRMERARRYGDYPGFDDPAAPAPPLDGVVEFNPFKGTWLED